jgi:electron transfer flavoprotein beta subunit
MKIAVCVKHAVDETELKIDSTGKPQLAGAAGKISAFDKNAVEEGARQKAAHQGEVVIFTVGPPESQKTVREALAMGGDRGVLITADPLAIDTIRTAGLLATAIKKSGPFDLVLCSEGSSDTYSGQVSPMLAEMLGTAFVSYARKVEISGQTATIERSLEDSVEIVETPTPLVTSVVSEINEPRYLTLIQIMQAKKKNVEELNGQQLLPEDPVHGHVSVRSISAQQSTRKHIMIEGSPDDAAAKLVDALTKDGVLSR